jgi:hypothetical protein
MYRKKVNGKISCALRSLGFTKLATVAQAHPHAKMQEFR